MAIGIREILQDVNETDVVLTASASTEVGDFFLATQYVDFYTAAEMVSPSPGTWTLIDTVDLGDNNLHMKVWYRFADSSGSQSITFSAVQDACNHAKLRVLTNVDNSSPIDVFANDFDFSGTDAVVPSMSPVGTTDLLAMDFGIGDVVTPSSYPTGSTAETSTVCGSFTSGHYAHETLSSSGSTGTKTLSWSGSAGWIAFGTAILEASAPVQDLNPGFIASSEQVFQATVENQAALGLNVSLIAAATQVFSPTLQNQSSLTLNPSFKSSSSTVFQCTLQIEGFFDPILVGDGSLADQIMAGLISQGFVFGSLVDREYARLLAKLGLAYTGAYTILDLYDLANEPVRIEGLEDA